MTTLPVPIEFELPGPEWEPVPPESLGVTNASFLAVRRGVDGEYTPTISISGDLRPDDATLDEIAEESLQLLRVQAEDVELVKRSDIGSAEAPAVTQLISATVSLEGRRLALRQAQVLVSFLDTKEPSKRAVVVFSCTTTDTQFDTVGREFQAMVASVRPTPEAPPEVEGTDAE